MKPDQFLSSSSEVKSIIRGLSLTKPLFVSSILMGERYSGKKSIIKELFPNSPFIDAKNTKELEDTLKKVDKIVIYNFEDIQDIKVLEVTNKQIIAISNKVAVNPQIENSFAFIYTMPPLRDRDKDIETLTNHYTKLIKQELMLDHTPNIDISSLDLSQNNRSLKSSIYKEVILSTLSPKDIEQILYRYFLKNLDGVNGYRENLAIFEKPLIKAGLKKYRSQLKLSTILGLNRNTLRKKIYELGIE
jgi:DNA-binding protein Fis